MWGLNPYVLCRFQKERNRMKEGVIKLFLVPLMAVMLMGNSVDRTAAAEAGGEPASLGILPVPERDGYMFRGWYTKPVGGIKVTESTLITESVTYYAHWKKIPKRSRQ